MIHKLLILIAALALVGCAGRTNKANQNANADATATESITELEPLTAE